MTSHLGSDNVDAAGLQGEDDKCHNYAGDECKDKTPPCPYAGNGVCQHDDPDGTEFELRQVPKSKISVNIQSLLGLVRQEYFVTDQTFVPSPNSDSRNPAALLSPKKNASNSHTLPYMPRQHCLYERMKATCKQLLHICALLTWQLKRLRLLPECFEETLVQER